MSEIKVNTIIPATGSQVTVAAQILGVPGTDPNHFATVSQLGGGGGAGGISRAQAQELVDTGVASANRHSDEQDELQNTQIALDITAAKTEAIQESKNYTDSKLGNFKPLNIIIANYSYKSTGGDPVIGGQYNTPVPEGVNYLMVYMRDSGINYGYSDANDSFPLVNQTGVKLVNKNDGDTYGQILQNTVGPPFGEASSYQNSSANAIGSTVCMFFEV